MKQQMTDIKKLYSYSSEQASLEIRNLQKRFEKSILPSPSQKQIPLLEISSPLSQSIDLISYGRTVHDGIVQYTRKKEDRSVTVVQDEKYSSSLQDDHTHIFDYETFQDIEDGIKYLEFSVLAVSNCVPFSFYFEHLRCGICNNTVAEKFGAIITRILMKNTDI